jgi:hypothetical protein
VTIAQRKIACLFWTICIGYFRLAGGFNMRAYQALRCANPGLQTHPKGAANTTLHPAAPIRLFCLYFALIAP